VGGFEEALRRHREAWGGKRRHGEAWGGKDIKRQNIKGKLNR
jgi:hypothetical protein